MEGEVDSDVFGLRVEDVLAGWCDMSEGVGMKMKSVYRNEKLFRFAWLCSGGSVLGQMYNDAGLLAFLAGGGGGLTTIFRFGV